MTSMTSSRAVAPIVCAPWCRDGDGHASEHQDDQRCSSAPQKVLRTLAPQWGDTDGGWHPSEAEVFVERGPSFPLAVVLYECGDQDYEVRLTPAEARSLAAHLIAGADLAEAAR